MVTNCIFLRVEEYLFEVPWIYGTCDGHYYWALFSVEVVLFVESCVKYCVFYLIVHNSTKNTIVQNFSPKLYLNIFSETVIKATFPFLCGGHQFFLKTYLKTKTIWSIIFHYGNLCPRILIKPGKPYELKVHSKKWWIH